MQTPIMGSKLVDENGALGASNLGAPLNPNQSSQLSVTEVELERTGGVGSCKVRTSVIFGVTRQNR